MSTSPKHTPEPWGVVYASDGHHHIFAADGPVAIVSTQINADLQEANARLLHAAPAMRALLARIADTDPIESNPDEGDECHYCGARRRRAHTPVCEWQRACDLLASIDEAGL